MAEKWKTLRHNGCVFPEDYKPQALPVSVKGKIHVLPPEKEEQLMFWVQKINTEYVKDQVFKNNFWKDFSKGLDPEIKDSVFPDEWDMSAYITSIDKFRVQSKLVQKKNKKKIIKEREARKDLYGYAEIDGKNVELANYIIEIPGLFMGRGQHPFRGRIKPRIRPEDVELNLDENAPIPVIENHNWKGVQHARGGLWTCHWIDKVTGKDKWILFSRSSSVVRGNEVKKFDKARKLANKMDKVNAYIEKHLTAKNKETRMVATVCKLIAVMSIRVGDEKGKNEAETFGASTLQVNHITIKDNTIVFDFLGKDSIRYHNEVQFEESVIKNISEFIKGKRPDEQIFDKISSYEVRRFLDGCMKGLRPKFFRTATASMLLADILKKESYTDKTEKQKLDIFTNANLAVARKLNHQNAVSKVYTESLDNMKKKLDEMKAENTGHIKNGDKKAQEKIEKRIVKLMDKIEMKERLKGVAIGTSKTNYIDSRIVMSWAKKQGVRIEKIYTKSLLKKFKWAENIEDTFYEQYVEEVSNG